MKTAIVSTIVSNAACQSGDREPTRRHLAIIYQRRTSRQSRKGGRKKRRRENRTERNVATELVRGTYLSRSVEPVRLYDETNSRLTSCAGDAPSSSSSSSFEACSPTRTLLRIPIILHVRPHGTTTVLTGGLRFARRDRPRGRDRQRQEGPAKAAARTRNEREGGGRDKERRKRKVKTEETKKKEEKGKEKRKREEEKRRGEERDYPRLWENEEVPDRERRRCSGEERWHAGATSPVPGSFRQHFRLRCATTIGGPEVNTMLLTV